MLWKLEELLRYCIQGKARVGLSDGRWVPARPRWAFSRWPAAWAVLTGRADAVLWTGQEHRKRLR